MRASFFLASGLTLSFASAACTPGTHQAAGGASSSSGATTAQGSTTASSMSGPSTSSAATTTTSTSSGGPSGLQLYQHAYPFDTANTSWTKSSITAVLGTDAPTHDIIAAVKLQKMDALYVVTLGPTGGQVVHLLHAGVWTTKPIDQMFPIPSTAKQDTTTPCMPTNPQGPPSVAVSTDPISFMFHVPSLGGTCGPGGNAESITMLGKTFATDFDIQADFTGSYAVQRPYHTDCYPDAYGPNDYALWGFGWIDPSQCGTQGFYRTFAWYQNHLLRETVAGVTPDPGPWSATDPQNPIFKTPAPMNQPNPDAIVASYLAQDPANPAAGTAAFFAP